MGLKNFYVIAASFMLMSPAWAGPISAGGDPDSPRAVCENQAGGTYEQGRSPEDIVPLCTISGGLVAYWTFFRVAKERETTQATNAFLNHPSAPELHSLTINERPEAYCRFVEGRPVRYQDGQGNSFGMCEFNDRSAIAQHTLLVGPSTYVLLANILKQGLR